MEAKSQGLRISCGWRAAVSHWSLLHGPTRGSEGEGGIMMWKTPKPSNPLLSIDDLKGGLAHLYRKTFHFYHDTKDIPNRYLQLLYTCQLYHLLFHSHVNQRIRCSITLYLDSWPC